MEIKTRRPTQIQKTFWAKANVLISLAEYTIGQFAPEVKKAELYFS